MNREQRRSILSGAKKPTEAAIQVSVGYNTGTGKITLAYSRNLNNVSFTAAESIGFAQAIIRAAKEIDPKITEGVTW